MTPSQMATHEAPDQRVADGEFELAGHPRAVDRRRGPKKHPLLESFIVLARRKSFILKSVCAAALGAIVLVLLLPDTYTANAKVLPANHASFIPAELVNHLSLPGGSSVYQSEVYVAMLHSEAIANRLIDRFSLMKVYGTRLRVDAIKILADRTEISLGKEGVISIAVDDRSPQRAADLTNGYVEELDTLVKKFATTTAGRQKEFLASQVKVVGEQLTNAEQALKATQERTGLVLFDSQTKTLIDEAAGMRARVAAQEVHVQWLRSFATPENRELARAMQELSALRDQESKLERGDGGPHGINVPMEKMPGARLEYERRDREVKFCEALLRLLTQQFKAAEIDEARADLIVQPVVETMDRAILPEQNSAPHRFLIVLSVTLLALLLAVSAAFLMEKVDRARKSPPKFPPRAQIFTYHLQKKPENIRKSG